VSELIVFSVMGLLLVFLIRFSVKERVRKKQAGKNKVSLSNVIPISGEVDLNTLSRPTYISGVAFTPEQVAVMNQHIQDAEETEKEGVSGWLVILAIAFFIDF
jgi:hypothetical protein